MRAALSAAEIEEDNPGVLTETYRGFRGRPSRATVSWQISRIMFCNPAKTLHHQLDGLRATAQLERRFSHRELFTIFANRAMFGEDIVGVEPASEHFFHKEPNQLLMGEAACACGLAQSPVLPFADQAS
jgi:membrane carboxypeptidase/penicillin-binding protein PbpC